MTRATPTLHVIGDSHAGLFTGLGQMPPVWPAMGRCALPGVHAVRLGPFLAYSLTRKGHPAQAAMHAALRATRPGEVVMMCFGEIDCRCHVVAQAARSGRTIARVAQELAQSYVRACAAIVRARGQSLRLAFWGAVPAAEVVENPETPTVGTYRQRASATRAFNASLRRAATSIGATMVDIGPDVTDDAGAQRREFFPDRVHLGPTALPVAVAALRHAGLVDASAGARLEAAAAALSMVPMQQTGAGSAATSANAAAGAGRVDLLIDRAAIECVARGARTIAILGGGMHTARVGLDGYRRRGLRVAAILDDRPSGEIDGVPVVLPAKCPRGVRAVVVSSDAHETTLARRAAELVAKRSPVAALRGAAVVRIYEPALGESLVAGA
ncbi:MAG: hypothetical protein ACK5WB_08240 [Phycisphaerales bacterium]|nr:hypothetical protein [Phycisphaeraceae bacterium]